MTSLAALVLVDRGELDVHAPVSHVLARVRAERQGRRRSCDISCRTRRASAAGSNQSCKTTSTTGTRARRCSPPRRRGGSRVRRPGTTPSTRAISSVRLCGGSPGKSLGTFFAEEIAASARRRLPHRPRARTRPPGLTRHRAAAAADRHGEPRRDLADVQDVHRATASTRTTPTPKHGDEPRSALRTAMAMHDLSPASKPSSPTVARSTASSCCRRRRSTPSSTSKPTAPTSCSAYP